MPVDRRTGSVGSDTEPVYYEVAGAGFPLVLCHGAGGNHSVWFRQVVAFAGRYRVVTWDHRGFGRSTSVGAGDFARSADDLRSILDELAIERAHVVAQSMGGWGALRFTMDHPERVASLTLCDTVGGITTPVVEQNWSDYVDRLRANPPTEALGTSPALGRRFVEEDPEGAALYQAIGSLNPDLAPEVLGGLLTTKVGTEELARVTCPTLLVVGEDDAIFPPHVIRDCADAIDGACFEVIAGAGHSAYFEEPERWNEIVGAFLDEHPG